MSEAGRSTPAALPRPAAWLAPIAVLLCGSACEQSHDSVAASVLVSLPLAYVVSLFALVMMISLWRRWIPLEVDVEWRWHLWVVAFLGLGVLAIDHVDTFGLLRLAAYVVVGFSALVCLAMRLGRASSPELWIQWMPPAIAALLAGTQALVLFAEPGSRIVEAFALTEDTLFLAGVVLGPIALLTMFVGSVVRWDSTEVASTPLDDDQILF